MGSLLPPHKDQEVSGGLLFLTSWPDFLLAAWDTMRGIGLVMEIPGNLLCWLCGVGRLGRQRSEIWSVTILSDSSHRVLLIASVTFWWPFYSHVLDLIGSEKSYWGRSSWQIEKKVIFNCECISSIQLDGLSEPICAAMCFIHFIISHCSENIWLKLLFFMGKMCSWCFYLFIYSFTLQVWGFKNACVNLKTCLYITHSLIP